MAKMSKFHTEKAGGVKAPSSEETTIYLENGPEYLLSDGYAVLAHWIYSNGQVTASGPLKDMLWGELSPKIEKSPGWQPTLATRPLIKLIMALKRSTDEQVT